MLVVDTFLAEPGMVLLRDIRSPEGKVIAKKDEKLTPEIIENIKNSGARFFLVKTQENEKDTGYGGLSVDQLFNMKNRVYNIMEYLSLNNGLSKSFFYELSDSIAAMTESLFTVGDLLKEMKIIEFYDDYTYQHSVGVMVTSLLLTKKLEDKGIRHFTAKEKLSLALGALLHDIGKSTIDKDITNKPDKLTDEEFTEMKKHPIHGKVLMRRLRPMLESVFGDSVDMSIVEQIVGCHHLRPDGKGYGIDPENDVIPKKISQIHNVLSHITSLEGKVKITESGRVLYEKDGKEAVAYGGKAKGKDDVVTETSLKAFMFQIEKEMGKSLEQNPYPSGMPKVSDLVWIVGLADAYDAMVSDRSYRLGMHPTKILKILEEEKGKQFYEPFVDAFKEIVVDYPVGSVVMFGDGNIGLVTEADKEKGKCEIIASLFGDIDAIGEARDFDQEDVLLGTRRLNEIEDTIIEKRVLFNDPIILFNNPVVLASREDFEKFIESSISIDRIEEAFNKIKSDPIFEGSREALTKVFQEVKESPPDKEDFDLDGP